MDQRSFTFLFYGFAVAWMIIATYLTSVAMRATEIRKQADRMGRMMQGSQAGSTAASARPLTGALPFHFGAAFLSVLWLFRIRQPVLALLLLGSGFALEALLGDTGELLAGVIGLAAALALGWYGSRMAVQAKHYSTMEDLEEGERRWNFAGKVLLVLGIFAYMLVGGLSAIAASIGAIGFTALFYVFAAAWTLVALCFLAVVQRERGLRKQLDSLKRMIEEKERHG
jgi:hypothetical protein